MLFAISLLLQTRFDININPIQIERGGGLGWSEKSLCEIEP